MNSLKIFNRQVGIFAAAAALLLAVIVPAIVSAAQLTERSIELSSSSINASGVTYNIKFTAPNAAGAIVVDFCGNSPLIGQSCALATDFSASAVTLGAATGFTPTAVSASSAQTVVVTGPITAGSQVTVALGGIHNPSVVGPLYARIVTYDTAANAADYVSTETAGTGAGKDANRVDEGGAAISITNTIGVSGAVLESMTFCVSAEVISKDCAGATTPTLKLGEPVGDTVALIPTAISQGTMWTQLSTNAASGAVVSLKSSAENCGGLLRAGAPTACNISPAQRANIAAGEAKFGVKTSAATNGTGATNPTGTLQAAPNTGYGATDFALNYTIGNTQGVTSTFGDLFLDTDGAPVNNKNMQLTFGASVSNDTPAGLYSADLSLIATGKF